jgi:hypothetical protein
VRVEFTGDVSGTTVVPTFTGHESFALWLMTSEDGTTAASETSSVNSPRTPYKNPKTKKQQQHC